MSDDPEATQLLELGIEAAKRGRKLLAYEYFSQVVSREPDNEEGWLWLGGMSENPAESLQCMERALTIDPTSKRASEGLNWAKAQMKKAEAEQAAAAALPPGQPTTTSGPQPEKPDRPAAEDKSPAQQSDFEYILNNFMQAGAGRKAAIVVVMLVLLFICCVGFFLVVNNLLGIV